MPKRLTKAAKRRKDEDDELIQWVIDQRKNDASGSHFCPRCLSGDVEMDGGLFDETPGTPSMCESAQIRCRTCGLTGPEHTVKIYGTKNKIGAARKMAIMSWNEYKPESVGLN